MHYTSVAHSGGMHPGSTHLASLNPGSAHASGNAHASILPSQRNELPAEILIAANRGWQLFPFLAQSRHASGATTLIGRATSDLDQLTHWAAEHVGCNWAVATGEASGIIVLAFDRVSAQRTRCHVAVEHQDDHIEQTLTTIAGSGESATRYAFFRWPTERRQRSLRRNVLPGTQLHSEDDFVLIPPSTHANGTAYTYLDPGASVLPAPAWLTHLAFEP